jgi:CHASE3 domain sensor protein
MAELIDAVLLVLLLSLIIMFACFLYDYKRGNAYKDRIITEQRKTIQELQQILKVQS